MSGSGNYPSGGLVLVGQWAFRTRRGPRAHAQLIGGEVSLLGPDAHAGALLAMRAAGREPMSMTHGDFDPGYLDAAVSAPDGRLRLPRVSFAARMRGWRGAVRPWSEAELEAHRRGFVRTFEDLRSRKGLWSYLAHNMTVTADNLPEVGQVARAVSRMRHQMMSFHCDRGTSPPRSSGRSSVAPGARQRRRLGRPCRAPGRRPGPGRALPGARGRLGAHPGGPRFHGRRRRRGCSAGHGGRGDGLPPGRASRPGTAGRVQRPHGTHPDTGELVFACVQHSVLDPAENAQLAVPLPLPRLRRGAEPGVPDAARSEQDLEPGVAARGQP